MEINKLKEYFTAVWIPEELETTSLTEHSPCKKCKIQNVYHQTAMYGTIADRQYMEAPRECSICSLIREHMLMCSIKLAWYESNDDVLNKK